MLEFRPIASSSEGCCYLLSGSNLPPLLIDCGAPMLAIRKATRWGLGQLGGVLISHAHGDHCASYKKLIEAGVNCYASAETWDALKTDTDYRAYRKMRLTPREETTVGGWQVMPFEAVHDVPGTLGFIVAGDGGKLLYLTDSAFSPYRFEGLTHIAIEANWSEALIRDGHRSGEIHSDRFRRTVRTHMSIERVVQMLKANDLSKVQEIHLLHLSDANSDEDEFKRMVQEATGLPVYVCPKAVMA